MDADTLEIGYIADPLHWSQWPMACGLLKRANRLGTEPWTEIEAGLASDAMQLVCIQTKGGDPEIYAVGVVRSAMTPRGEMLDIVLASGHDHRIWATWALERLRAAARGGGMAGVRIFGRPGWQRVFRDVSGVKRQFVTLEMAA